MISVNDLKFSYSNNDINRSYALNGVNIEIKNGEFVCILGHNGSGKSTLAKHFNAILLPEGGKVYVDGMDTSNSEELWNIRSNTAMVFQNPDNQIVATIVEEDVAFAAENLAVPPNEIQKRVDESLKAVDMLQFKNYAPHMLSGGQKQRVAIAGVIAMQPKTIVFDEPTAMLDPSGRREVLKTIRKLNKEYNITIILITHNMDEAVAADRVIVMEKGKIIKDDIAKNVFCEVDEMKRLGLDVPQVTYLAYLLNKMGLSVKKDILTTDECVKELLKLCL